MEHHPAIALPGYTVVVRKTPRSKRADWEVVIPDDTTPADRPEFVEALRRFFAEFDEQISAHVDDPIATGQALTKIEALLADLRYLAGLLRNVTAASMDAGSVRRITVEGIGVWEASSSLQRSNWQTSNLVAEFLLRSNIRAAVTVDGEIVEPLFVADIISELYGSSTAPRITPLRGVGMDPDEFCDVAEDEEGAPVRTATVRVVDNQARKVRS